jgi:hypothetical protein
MIVEVQAEDIFKGSIFYKLFFEDADSDHFVLKVEQWKRESGGVTELTERLAENRIQIKKSDIKRLAKSI